MDGASYAPDRDGQDLIEGTARVVAVDGGVAWLEPEQTTSCGSCASSGACGSKSGQSAVWLTKRRFAITNDDGLQVGERVVMGVQPGWLLRASAAAYGVPLVTLLAGGILGDKEWGGDGAAVIGALIGLVIGLVIAKLWAGRQMARGDLTPRYLRRAYGPGSGDACHVD